MARTKKSLDNVDITDLLKDLNKEFSTTETLPRVKSELLSLDIVLGGQGIPLGKTIEIASASGVGKSTLLLHVSRNLCRQGYRVVWLDTEYATDDELLRKMGLMDYKDDLFNIFQVGTFEEVEKILDTLMPTGQVQFIVLDSLANLTSAANLASTVYNKDIAKSVENKQVAGDARSQTMFMKKYKTMCAKNNITMFFVNQLITFRS